MALNPTKFKLDKSVMSILQEIEEAFKCSGICDYGNFYFFVDVSEGPPTQTCKGNMNIIFSNISLNIGIVLAVSFFLLILTFIIQYWFIFCRKNDDEITHVKPVKMTEFAEADTSRGANTAIFGRHIDQQIPHTAYQKSSKYDN